MYSPTKIRINIESPSHFRKKKTEIERKANAFEQKSMRVCHKSMAHPFRFFSFFQIRN